MTFRTRASLLVVVQCFLASMAAWAHPISTGSVILHFSDFGPPGQVAGSAVSMNLLRQSQARAGKRPFIVLPDYDHEKFPAYQDPDYIIRLPRGVGFQSSANYKRLVAMIQNGEVGIIHAHKEGPYSRLGLSLARHFSIPSVITAHMMVGPFLRDHFSNKPPLLSPFFSAVSAGLEKDYMSYANGFDVVTAATPIVENYLRSQGVSRPLVLVAPAGIDTQKFRVDASVGREYLLGQVDVLSSAHNSIEQVDAGKVEGNTIGEKIAALAGAGTGAIAGAGASAGASLGQKPVRFLVMLSRLSAEKGVEDILDLWPQAAAHPDYNIHLVIAGLGGVTSESRQIFRKLMDHPEAGKTLHYIGARPYDQIPFVLAGGDVVISASRHETFGLSVVEAGAAGKPVVAPKLPAFDSILENGRGAILLSPFDAPRVSEALIDIFGASAASGRERPARYQEMARAAREHAGLFSSERVNAQMDHAYELARQHASGVAQGRRLDARSHNFFKTPLALPDLCLWALGSAVLR